VGFSAGDRIGNYEVERVLGATPSGVVLQVTHCVLPRRAVLKVLHVVAAAVQPLAVQILREACILEALAHPGVPLVYESGLMPDRRPWFAYQQVSGTVLTERIMRAAMPPLEVAALIRDIATVLEHTHRRGVIHRGLHPDRIALTPEHRFPIVIVDWSDAVPHDTATPAPHVPTPGSRSYVAPEMIAEDPIDDRIDVFSLGVIAYRALTGVMPFTKIFDAEPYIFAGDRRPDAPRELTTIIDAMLAFDRFDRPSSAEVRSDLAWLLDALREAPAKPIDTILPTAGPRIRKPRWTPAISTVTSEISTDVVGEIGADKPTGD
jgi:eukaryotic-like serine/threonine-protein kinase